MDIAEKEVRSIEYAYMDDIDEVNLAKYVGSKYDSYYKEKWPKNNAITLNFAAFVFGIFWLAYRGMLFHIAVIAAAYGLLASLLIYLGYETLSNYLNYLINFGLLIFGNRLYRDFSCKRVKRIERESASEDLKKKTKFEITSLTLFNIMAGCAIFILVVGLIGVALNIEP